MCSQRGPEEGRKQLIPGCWGRAQEGFLEEVIFNLGSEMQMNSGRVGSSREKAFQGSLERQLCRNLRHLEQRNIRSDLSYGNVALQLQGRCTREGDGRVRESS